MSMGYTYTFVKESDELKLRTIDEDCVPAQMPRNHKKR